MKIVFMKYILVLLFFISCGESRKEAFNRGLHFCADYHYMYGSYPSIWLQEQVFKNPQLGEDTLVNHPISKGFINPLDTVYVVDDTSKDSFRVTVGSRINIFDLFDTAIYTATYDSLGNIYFKEK